MSGIQNISAMNISFYQAGLRQLKLKMAGGIHSIVVMAADGSGDGDTAAAALPSTEVTPDDLTPSAIKSFLESLLPAAKTLIFNIIIALVIYFVGRKIIKIVLNMMDHALSRTKVDVGVAKFLHSVSRVAMYAFLAFLIIDQLGVNTASIVTVLGTAGLAIGLSLQGSLSNMAGGVLILLMKPFKVGDYIISSYGEGTVSMIGTVYTTIITVDNKVLTIPNGEISNAAVTDVTAMPQRRLDITVGIGYEADLKKAKEILSNVFTQNPYIDPDREVQIFVDSLGDSAVNLGAQGWVDTGDYLKAKWEITEQIKISFDEAGISIPFPQMDVHVMH